MCFFRISSKKIRHSGDCPSQTLQRKTSCHRRHPVRSQSSTTTVWSIAWDFTHLRNVPWPLKMIKKMDGPAGWITKSRFAPIVGRKSLWFFVWINQINQEFRKWGLINCVVFFGDKLDLLPCFLIQNLWTMTFLRFSCFIVMQSILSRLLVLVTTLILEYIQHIYNIYTSYINSYFVHIIAWYSFGFLSTKQNLPLCGRFWDSASNLVTSDSHHLSQRNFLNQKQKQLYQQNIII